MWLASLSSSAGVGVSLMMKIISNLVRRGIGNAIFSVRFWNGLYFPSSGLAAARIAVLAFSVA